MVCTSGEEKLTQKIKVAVRSVKIESAFPLHKCSPESQLPENTDSPMNICTDSKVFMSL